MEVELRDAFDKIRAEDALKERTADFLRKEMGKPRLAHRITCNLRFAAACASLLLLLSVGGYSLRLYFTPAAFVDMDVNPSVGLEVNRFGRVLKATAYNEDAAGVLQNIQVRNHAYERAVQSLLDEMIRRGYLGPEGVVAVTVQAGDGAQEKRLLDEVQSSVDALLSSHHVSAAADVFTVSREVRVCAHEKNLSPAKYLAIAKLRELDPTATFEGCAEHSIGELQRLVREHGDRHHESGAESQEKADAAAPPHHGGGHHAG